ncbi:hypothetical protein SCYAM73S_05010 [Streptomyces cyaneofuscatus]
MISGSIPATASAVFSLSCEPLARRTCLEALMTASALLPRLSASPTLLPRRPLAGAERFFFAIGGTSTGCGAGCSGVARST